MLVLEKKVDAVMRYCLAVDQESRNKALEGIRTLMAKITDQRKDPESILRRILLDIGVPDHVIGHGYLLTAATICLQDSTAIHNITGYLYPVLAKKLGTTKSCVERNIRHAIETAWCRADPDVIQRYFGNTVSPNKAKPTNGEFIARICAEARQQIKNYEEFN